MKQLQQFKPNLIIGCSKSQELAKSLARKLGCSYAPTITRIFPDGELYLKLPVDVKGKRVAVVQTLHEPNLSLLELIFAAVTAKELGAKSIELVVPYLAYMRQDKRFHHGESLSSKIVMRMLDVGDRVVTIDPHLHRYHSLHEVFKEKSTVLSAAPLLGEYIKKHIPRALVIGPDAESYQWVDKITAVSGSESIVLKKKRYSSTDVRIVVPKDVEVSRRPVAIVDDIISSGHTMLEVVKEMKKRGAFPIYCLAVHGIFGDNADQKLRAAGARVVVTNAVPHSLSTIDVAELLSTAWK